MSKAQEMGLIKVEVTEDVCGWPVGFVGYWDEDRKTNAGLNNGDVVWDEGMTDYWYHDPQTLKVLE